jgi:glycosyltransferase involved in cell wall biosynthesis
VSATSIPSDEQRRQQPASEVWDGPPVVIVHDWIGGVHGAERVLKELSTLFPAAPILALMADRRVVRALGIDPSRVRQSYLGRVPNAIALRKAMLPWFADAVQTLDVGDASLILSSSHAVAKAVPHRSYQRHLAYVYSPMRYAHDLLPQYLREVPAILRPWFRGVLRKLAMWDVATAQRVARYVGISRAVAERIWRTYRRHAAVVHPPVEVAAIPLGGAQSSDYYIAMSRLASYKRIDLAIRAAAQLGRRLVVVGEGPERTRLEAVARASGGKLIEFAGRVGEAEKFRLLGGARALLFPGEEDFGIVGVEALATGVPVVALGRGGMLDVVDAPRTLLGPVVSRVPGGVVVGEQTAEAMVQGIKALENGPATDRSVYRELALRFSTDRFRRRMLTLARRTLEPV